jgi:Bacterial extracellular solute-binding protein/von Willebrand factor type A domain
MVMGRHRLAHSTSILGIAIGLVAALIVVMAVTVYLARPRGTGADLSPRPLAGSCANGLRVLTATSFAPVLAAMTAELDRGDDCVRLEVDPLDGRAAVQRLDRADVWIPDDGSWAGTAPAGALTAKGTVGAGTVLATSPIYMVTDRATGDRIDRDGGSWSVLAGLLTNGSGVRLAVRDPAGSGDGLVGAGAVAEAVWLDKGMDASALDLGRVLKVTRTVTGSAAALPTTPGEVGLVPTAAAASDPRRSAGLRRLFTALTGSAVTAPLRSARLRAPDGSGAPDATAGRLPPLTAKPYDVLAPHHIDHVLATWYPEDRRMNLLVVTDVSGSMGSPAPGTSTPLIDLVREGCGSVRDLLPNDARLGLWEFGVNLDPPHDYRVLVPIAPLTDVHRNAVSTAIKDLATRNTGTGLYNTIIDAYKAARDSYRAGVPNQVMIFTDGRNEDDPHTITAAELSRRLAAAKDPARPVQLSVVTFGQPSEGSVLGDVVKPVDGYVEALDNADKVAATFIHLAAGGLHGPS